MNTDRVSTIQEKHAEAVRLLKVVRQKFGGLLLVSYEDEYRRNDDNLRVKIDKALAALNTESEKE
jgi:hypothetical protein